MKIGKLVVPEDSIYIIPLGDLHIGDEAFSKESKSKLHGYIDFVRDREDSFVFLNGDLLNTATRVSKTSPFEQTMPLDEQINTVVFYLSPIKDKIIGAVTGNHESRVEDFVGYNPTMTICQLLGVPYYGYTAVIDFKVGNRTKEGKQTTRISYTGVFSHTTGGGATVGSKMNRVAKMTESTITNGDFYCGSHNHMLGAVPIVSNEYDSNHGCFSQRKQMLIDCGGYLAWDDSYAEKSQLRPMKLGSPRIRLDGKVKDIHVSL